MGGGLEMRSPMPVVLRSRLAEGAFDEGVASATVPAGCITSKVNSKVRASLGQEPGRSRSTASLAQGGGARTLGSVAPRGGGGFGDEGPFGVGGRGGERKTSPKRSEANETFLSTRLIRRQHRKNNRFDRDTNMTSLKSLALKSSLSATA